MSKRTARRLSGSIAVFSVLLVITGLVISILALVVSGKGVTFSHQFFTPLLTITYCTVGALVVSRHPSNPIGWMFCITGFLSALNMLSAGYALYSELAMLLPGATLVRWFSSWIWIPNVLLPFTFALLLFPDGKLLSMRWRPVAWAAGLSIVLCTLSIAFHPGPLKEMGMTAPNPYGLAIGAEIMNALLIIAAPFVLVSVLASIASIVVRFRKAVGIGRSQLKWLAVAGVIVIVGNILGSIPWLIQRDNSLSQEFSIVATDFTIVTIVIATGFAILRYQLWDIHIVVNRTLVFGSLTALIVAIYVVIVGSLGTLLQTSGSLPVSLLGTGIVAMSFQPLRERLQRGVNRLMYGERDEPYAVLSRLSERLEDVIGAQSVLPTIVETVADAFRLPYVAIALKEREGFIIVAEQAVSPTHVHTDHSELFRSSTLGLPIRDDWSLDSCAAWPGRVVLAD